MEELLPEITRIKLVSLEVLPSRAERLAPLYSNPSREMEIMNQAVSQLARKKLVAFNPISNRTPSHRDTRLTRYSAL